MSVCQPLPSYSVYSVVVVAMVKANVVIAFLLFGNSRGV